MTLPAPASDWPETAPNDAVREASLKILRLPAGVGFLMVGGCPLCSSPVAITKRQDGSVRIGCALCSYLGTLRAL